MLGLKQTHNNAPIVFKHPVNIVGSDGFCDTLYGFRLFRQIWLNWTFERLNLYRPYRHDDVVQRVEVLELVGVVLPGLAVLDLIQTILHE